MKKFEYKKITGNLEEEDLNELGLEGWELVSHTTTQYTKYGEKIKDCNYGHIYFFKREIINN